MIPEPRTPLPEYGPHDLSRALTHLDVARDPQTLKLDLLEGVLRWYVAREQESPEWWEVLWAQVVAGEL